MATKPWGGRSPSPNVAPQPGNPRLWGGDGEVPQWGGARKINFNWAPPSAVSGLEEKNPKHHPKFPLLYRAEMEAKKGVRQSQARNKPYGSSLVA